MNERSSTLIPPAGNWWQPLGRDERLWVSVVVVWALAMFVMMQFIWPAIGDQQIDFGSYRGDAKSFAAEAEAFIKANQVGEEGGVPVVAPPPGDIYLTAERFQWRPILRLKRGQTYRLLLSSKDVQHGFSLQPDNVNFQVLPGYISAIRLTAKKSGNYPLLCNEFCGLGHHVMLGRIEVTE